MITLLWASLPLGGVLGSMVSTLAMPAYGWKALFYFGGVAPLLVAGGAALWLPESPRFLARSAQGRTRLRALLGQIRGRPVADVTQIIVPRAPAGRGSVAGLFREGLATSTFLLWGAFFFSAILAVLVPLWSPTLLQGAGYSVAQSSIAVALFNIGAIVGMATLGVLIDRFGATRVLTSILLLCAITTGPIGFVVGYPAIAAMFFTLAGLGAGGGVAGVVAVTAMLYPTTLRSTGIGCAAAAGRIGQMLGPVASGALIAIGWGIGAIFAVIAIPPLLAAVLVAALGSHTNDRAANAPQPIAPH
jgi:AAHS family 4-hydroxybenzoate transporter-like MFS transporter